jgi:hypothetical protein
MEENYEEMCVWVNKEDLKDQYNLIDKLVKIKGIEMLYGMCFILSEDLTEEQLRRIFK